MSQSLVIVESPTKARTISRFLGSQAQVMACMGHVRDLPSRSFGVDIADNFKPHYVLTPNGKKALSGLKQAAKDAEHIYLATDPDREGEAIAWHLQEALKKHTEADFRRVSFHEITRAAIQKAFDDPESLNWQKVDAQQARRILDRLVGYKLSPLLWKHVQKGTSAGRVQSVALRMVCERERVIQAFKPEEYWNFTALFQADRTDTPFKARLVRVNQEKPQINDAAMANSIAEELQTAKFEVTSQKKLKKQQRPSPPFITSTLQQTAGSVARFSTRQTMQISQQLYEGIDIGSGEAVGLITYMRTDSVSVSREAQQQAMEYVRETMGAEYVPEKPNRYKSGRGAQEAHEAIRPTDVRRTPQQLAKHLNSSQLRLYSLIWTRFMASQMAPAKLLEHTVEVSSSGKELKHHCLFRATETKTLFPGFKALYKKSRDTSKKAPKDANILPEVPDGTACDLLDLEKEQKFTEPPKRFSEATLVRELEHKGVGRPSTYATIVHTIQKRSYVIKNRGTLSPTELGFNVNDYLVETVPELFQVEFTANMESELDNIEEGEMDSTAMLQHFYDRFRTWVKDVELVAAPDNQSIKEFVELFPEDISWREPVKRGRQTFDDQRFFESLRKQALGMEKKLSDKQWQALLTLAARYADEIPGIREKAKELNVLKELELLIKKENAEPTAEGAGLPPTEETMEYLDRLAGVTDWMAPSEKSKRAFNDKSFVDSIREQVNAGRRLTLAQKNVLRNLVVKYRDQIQNFKELADKHGLRIPEKKETIDQEVAERLMNGLSQVQKFNPPQKRGRRTFDDEQFANSLQSQFKEKHTLTKRQAGAAQKLLSRYRDQIENYDTLAAELGIKQVKPSSPAKADNAEKTKMPCPECDGTLVLRQSKRGQFYGCSNFPKCRFTKPMVEKQKD